ncbi:hypothetical protein, partial [Pseudomonas sp.]|uniref:hypothetical protein n=2 Tax=Pseudomonas TaxID=286 RepID=UPI003BB0D54A
LVKTLNICMGENALEERVLEKIFDVYWPSFSEEFAKALEENPQNEVVAPREDEDILAEILENTRALGKRVGQLERSSTPKERYSESNERQFLGGGNLVQARKRVDNWVTQGYGAEEINQLLSEMRYSLAQRHQLSMYASSLIAERGLADATAKNDE